jgi:hypothetical protein
MGLLEIGLGGVDWIGLDWIGLNWIGLVWLRTRGVLVNAMNFRVS